MAWRCLLCPSFTALWLVSLLTHYNSNHSHEDRRFTIRCDIEGCTKEYCKVNSFTKHVRSVHRRFLHCSTNDIRGEPVLLEGVHSAGSQGSASNNEPNNNSEDESSALTFGSLPSAAGSIEAPSDQSRDSADGSDDDDDEPLNVVAKKFVYKIRGENRLTGKAVQSIALATRHVIHGLLRTLKRKVEDVLHNADTVDEEIQTVGNLFDEAAEEMEILQTPLSETFSIRDDHTGLDNVQPVKHILGQQYISAKRHKKKRIVEVDDVFYYISVLQTIQLQLGCPQILEMVLAGPQKSADESVLEDFCNGTLFQEHVLFSNDDRALHILLYYDDVNFINPMTNKNHKLSFFYYQLANLSPLYRSKLKSIHLFAVCKTEHLSNPKYGFNKIMEPLVAEMKLLGSDRGFTFSLPCGLINLRGGILAFLADTPASNKAGGFKEGVGGAKRKCRHCMATFEDMQCYFTEEDFHQRNIDEHEQHLLKLEGAASKFLRDFYSKHYGINSRTVLLESPYFDPCEQLVQDVMHVFLEGVLAYEIRLLLNYYINEIKVFKLTDLNSRIQGFPYGFSNIKNKPAVILDKDLQQGSSTNMGQSASQMWLLCSVLPFILAELVDIDTDRWKCFISIIEIMSLCFAHKISIATIVYLKKAIKDHLNLFKTVYKDINIIPKQHYLVHLPSLTLKFGPLVRSWCLRFEAKHAFFKDQARIIKNFKQLPLSLSKRYQSSVQADYVKLNKEDEGPLFREEVKFGVSKELFGDDRETALSNIHRFYELGSHDGITIYSLDSVNVHGTLYKPDKDAFLHFGSQSGLPQFGKIVKIWFIANHRGIYFALHVVTTLKYNEDLNAFQIKEPDLPQGFEIVRQEKLELPFVCHPYKLRENTYVILKENPFAWL